VRQVAGRINRYAMFSEYATNRLDSLIIGS
jgi:hypothetical protein